MKRLSAILFTLVYLLCSTGVPASVHFCGGELEGISFFRAGDKECCCGSKMPVKSCCKTKTAYYKVPLSHKPAPNTGISYNSFSIAQPAQALITEVPVYAAEISGRILNSKPPDQTKHPVYLTNRMLII